MVVKDKAYKLASLFSRQRTKLLYLEAIWLNSSTSLPILLKASPIAHTIARHLLYFSPLARHPLPSLSSPTPSTPRLLLLSPFSPHTLTKVYKPQPLPKNFLTYNKKIGCQCTRTAEKPCSPLSLKLELRVACNVTGLDMHYQLEVST